MEREKKKQIKQNIINAKEFLTKGIYMYTKKINEHYIKKTRQNLFQQRVNSKDKNAKVYMYCHGNRRKLNNKEQDVLSKTSQLLV